MWQKRGLSLQEHYAAEVRGALTQVGGALAGNDPPDRRAGGLLEEKHLDMQVVVH